MGERDREPARDSACAEVEVVTSKERSSFRAEFEGGTTAPEVLELALEAWFARAEAEKLQPQWISNAMKRAMMSERSFRIVA